MNVMKLAEELEVPGTVDVMANCCLHQDPLRIMLGLERDDQNYEECFYTIDGEAKAQVGYNIQTL